MLKVESLKWKNVGCEIRNLEIAINHGTPRFEKGVDSG